MASRLWLPSSGAAPILTVPFDASWNITTGASRFACFGAPIGTTMAQRSVAETSATNPTNYLGHQWVSAAIPADITISGTLTANILNRSSFASSYPARPRVIAKVVTPAGGIRGVLGTIQWGGASSYPYLTCQEFSGAITPVNAIAGDRVIFEIGTAFINAVTTSVDSNFAVGDHFDTVDGVSGATTTSFDYRSWVELSQDDIWGPVPRKVAGSSIEVMDVSPVPVSVRVGGVSLEVGSHAVSAPIQVAGSAVELLRGRAGQQLRRRLYSKTGHVEPLAKFPGLGWRAIRPVPLPEEEPQPPIPLCLVANSAVTPAVTSIGTVPLQAGDVLVITYLAGRSPTPRNVIAGPTPITNVTWTHVVGGIDTPRHGMWIGHVTGPTVMPSTVGITLDGSDSACATYVSAWRGITGTMVGTGLADSQPFPHTLTILTPMKRNRVLIGSFNISVSGTITPINPVKGWVTGQTGTAQTAVCISPFGDGAGSISMQLMTNGLALVNATVVVLE